MSDSFRDKVASWEKTAGILDSLIGSALARGMTGGGGGGGGTQSVAGLTRMPVLKGGVLVAGGLGTAGAATLVGKAPADTWSYRLNRRLHDGVDGLLLRVKADEEVAKKLVGGAADKAMDIVENLFTAGAKSYQENLVNSPMRHAILNQLKKEDDIIAGAPTKQVMEAYHTMSKIAPTLSTDKNAVKSFLREAAQHEGGVDYMTLKGLGEAEAVITGAAYRRGK
tara:strand:+ start:2416 stop:3087 length:672 start_codon:yes stop_codon:yes gene_type:complete